MTLNSILTCNGHTKYNEASLGTISQLKGLKPVISDL